MSLKMLFFCFLISSLTKENKYKKLTNLESRNVILINLIFEKQWKQDLDLGWQVVEKLRLFQFSRIMEQVCKKFSQVKKRHLRMSMPLNYFFKPRLMSNDFSINIL